MIDRGQPLPAHWEYYRNHSLKTHHARCDHHGYGREEHLNETLRAIGESGQFDAATLNRLDGVAWNRAKKHRRLKMMLFSGFGWPKFFATCCEKVLITSDTVSAVRQSLKAGQWEVEWRLASGEPFQEIARDLGVAVGTLKVRVSRWRSRLRCSSAASHRVR